MPIYEDKTTTQEKLQELRRSNSCSECGGRLDVFMDIDKGRAFLACGEWHRTHHEGIVREANEYEQKGLESLTIKTRREIMAQQFGEQKTRALEQYHGVTSLTRAQAKEILLTVFPDAPEVELQRAVLLCASYSLNPLMGHVFLIPFNKGKQNETWATVIGIKAKRLLASRRHSFSYLDDSPRMMTEKEQVKIFGKVSETKLKGLTILQDTETGAIARGYGEWEKGKEPYGTDKGNSAENMTFIRSESQAIDRLCPGEMPVGIGVIDEQFVAPPNEDAKPIQVETTVVSKKPAITKAPPSGKAEQPSEGSGEPTPNTLADLKEIMAQSNWSATDVGKFCVAKGWKIRDYKDLTPEQLKELIQDIKNNPK